MSNIILIIFYFAIVFTIGLWTKRRETNREYLNADKKVGVAQATASIVAVMGGIVLTAQATLGFEMGITAAWYFVGYAIALLILGSCAHKIKKLADKYNFLTLSDYFASKFDFKNKVLSAIIIFVSLFALLVGQFIAAGSLFSPLFGVSYSSAILIVMFATLFYLNLGGFKAVVKTDFLQFIIMLAFFCLVLFFIDFKSFSYEQINVFSMSSSSIVVFIILGIFAIIPAADIWQRIFAAKDIKTARTASILSGFIFLFFGIIVTLIGVTAKNNFPGIKGEEALYYGIFQLLPPHIAGLAVVFVLAAIMSTIDTELFYLSSSLSKDFRKEEQGKEILAKKVRKFIFIIAIISSLVAIMFSNIVLIIFGIISLLMALSPAIITSFFWKIKSNAVFLSMISGVVALLVLVVTENFNPDNAIITLPVAAVFLIIGQIFFKHKEY